MDNIVDTKYIIRNKYNIDGYIELINNHYLFHPKNLYETSALSINMRGPASSYNPNIITSIDDEIITLINKNIVKVKDKNINIDKIFNKLKEVKTNEFKIKSIISKLSINLKIKLIEKSILIYNSSKEIPYIYFNVLKYFKYYLIDGLSLKINNTVYNRNFDSYFNNYQKTKIKKDTRKKFIGHILNYGNPVIIGNNNIFNLVNKSKLINTKKIPENNYVVGISQFDNYKGQLTFKLKFTVAIYDSIDKRLITKGFKCNQINNKQAINEIYIKLLEKEVNKKDFSIDKKNIKIDDYCIYVEKLLRKRQFDNPNTRWFYI